MLRYVQASTLRVSDGELPFTALQRFFPCAYKQYRGISSSI